MTTFTYTSTFIHNGETVYVYNFKCVNSCGKPAVLKSYMSDIKHDDGKSVCAACEAEYVARNRHYIAQTTCG